MTLTLHLTPELEAQLHAEASRSGKDPSSLILEALEEKLAWPPEPERLTTSSQLAAFRDWVASMPESNIQADFSRESIYGNRGE